MVSDNNGNGHNGNGNGRKGGEGGFNGNNRDRFGRFAPGNPGGPGRGMTAAVERMRQALVDACTEEDVEKVALKLLSEAKDGKPWAVTELLNRLFGKPRQQVDVSGLPEPIKHLAGLAEDKV